MTKGFTLIEVIVYVALFSILIGSAFAVTYQLFDSSNKLNSKNTTQEEANFVLRKLDWALSGIDPSTIPIIAGTACNQSLSVTKSDASLSPIAIRFNTVSGVNYIEISEHGGAYYPLTTSNVSISCLKFSSISGSPSGITAIATIDGLDFTTTKYIRK